jgi:hypothetical protein
MVMEHRLNSYHMPVRKNLGNQKRGRKKVGELYEEESKEAHAYYFLPPTSRLIEEEVKELRGRHIASIEVKGSNNLGLYI